MKNFKKLVEASKIYTQEDAHLQTYLEKIDKFNGLNVDISDEELKDVSVEDLRSWCVGLEDAPEAFSKFSRDELTKILIEKLDRVEKKQAKIWEDFVAENNDVVRIKELIDEIWNTQVDHPMNAYRYHVLNTLKLLHTGGLSTVSPELIRRGVMGLLANIDQRNHVYIHYLSDTIRDLDATNSRIIERYRVLGKMFGVAADVDYLGSTPGRSIQTGTQVVQIIGQSAELYLDKHKMNQALSLSIMVNNADRSKHKRKEKAQGSQCLWARVHDPKTDVIHDVIGVDNEVFSVYYDNILELYVVHGIPDDKNFEDLSKGTQFRSLHNFPYVQILNAISGGGCPAGFNVEKVNKDDYLDRIEMENNEIILADKDHYLNGKCLSNYQDGIIGLCKELGADLDEESLLAQCYHPDTGEILKSLTATPTEYLGKHPGKVCIWNGSSRGFDGQIFIEFGKSKGHAEDEAAFIEKFPVGTRVVLSKLNT